MFKVKNHLIFICFFCLLVVFCITAAKNDKKASAQKISETEYEAGNAVCACIEIINKTETLDLLREYTLLAKVTQENPLHAAEFSADAVVWTSSNPEIITVDDNGKITAKKPGKAVITASGTDTVKSDSVNMEVIVNPMYLFEKFHIGQAFGKEVITNGIVSRKQYVTGSVSLYWTGPLNLEKKIIAVNSNLFTGLRASRSILKAAEPLKNVRTGILLEEIKYITYHDTGNNSPGADASLHGYYLTSDENIHNRARSWHYTIDDKKAIQHIPGNEAAWHGDSYDSYAKSIGIETCIGFGSDLYKVWQRTAKLIASLLIEFNLEPDAVKQHYEWSGKNCPETLRNNDLFEMAMDMIKAEYYAGKYLTEYNITFESLNTEYVNHHGNVIKAPVADTTVSYIVDIKNNAGYSETKEFISIIKGIK
ncbi:MAG: N-acetylmuramoyl-L-alanine amidase [Treponema sp.]|nr:N-acetylmuramoyl-L-alanine amidase [Treponema sp.]